VTEIQEFLDKKAEQSLVNAQKEINDDGMALTGG
jgi:hypothetical protein